MSPPLCDYLAQDHSALRASPELRVKAVHVLLDAALRHGERVRLEFDRARLLRALGPQAAALLPHLSPSSRGPLERHEEALDDERKRLLRRVLSFERDEGFPDPPLNYIERVILFDARGKVILRASDSAGSILFTLPDEERRALLERYRVEGIPADAIEQVEVDIEQGI